MNDWREELAEVERLVRERPPDAVNSLVAALRATDTAVVDAAAEGLITLRAEEALPELLEAWDTLDEGEGDQIQSVLDRRRDSWVGEACVRLLTDAPDSRTRALAAEALGYPLQAADAVGVLRAATEDKDESVRAAATESLRQLRGE